MNANTEYEIKAEAFRRMTGMMAPGKYEGVAGSAHTYEERCKRWEEWTEQHGQAISATLKAVDAFLKIVD